MDTVAGAEPRPSAVDVMCSDGRLLDVLYVGNNEPLKAGVHGLLLFTAAVCAAYNAAAWLRRREPHLAVNAVLYTATVWWEAYHVQGHLTCRPESEPSSSLSEAA